MNDFPTQNTGLIEGSGTKSLWLGGTIPYEVRLESGDWRPFDTTHEKQRDPLETMGCVSFSLNNCLETQYKFFRIEQNFSDRFLAKMSGTTLQGNRLDIVADTARLVGLVQESEWSNVPKISNWNTYYKDIPPEVIAKAVKQPIQYEAVHISTDNLKKELKHCPLQVTIPAPHPNHAVTLMHIDGTTAYIKDHYSQAIRTITVSDITYALKILLTKPMNDFVKTINLDGEIAGYVPLRSPADIELFNKIFNKRLTQNPDSTIPTDIKATKV